MTPAEAVLETCPEVGARREALAGDVLHRHEQQAVLLAEVMHAHDVRMRDLAGQGRRARARSNDLGGLRGRSQKVIFPGAGS